jgi:hypothetical protein
MTDILRTDWQRDFELLCPKIFSILFTSVIIKAELLSSYPL